MHDKGYSGKSQNSCVNHKGKIHGGGEVKSTSRGVDLGPKATNKIADIPHNEHLSAGPRHRKHS